jgi:hypothetical protein
VEELIPVLAGVLVAVVALGLSALRSSVWPLLVAALLGAMWSIAIGEAARSWFFVLVDAAQSVAAMILLQWLGRRAFAAWGASRNRR